MTPAQREVVEHVEDIVRRIRSPLSIDRQGEFTPFGNAAFDKLMLLYAEPDPEGEIQPALDRAYDLFFDENWRGIAQ